MTANPLKGEVELVVGETTYVLCYSSNAIVQVEQLLGESIGVVSGKASHVEYQRALLWGALQKHHSAVNLLAAGAMMDDFEGGTEELMDKLARTLRFRISRTPIDAPLLPAEDDGGD